MKHVLKSILNRSFPLSTTLLYLKSHVQFYLHAMKPARITDCQNTLRKIILTQKELWLDDEPGMKMCVCVGEKTLYNLFSQASKSFMNHTLEFFPL